MSRKHFEVVRHYLKNAEWDYFQFVEIGLDRMHHGFWKPPRPRARPARARQPVPGDVIRDYYRYLDEELGSLLELLTDDTIVLVVSDHGAQRLDGGFCVNEWLIQQGWLVLNQYPEKVTPFSKLDVNWEKTQRLERGGLLRPRLLQREGPRAQGRDRGGRLRPLPRRGQGTLRGDHRRRGEAARDARLPARRDLHERAQRGPRPDRPLRRRSPGGRSAASATRRSTSSRTTPGRTTATTPSTARSSSPRRTTRCAARSRGRTCWTSPRRSWSWAATTSPPRCRADRWWRAWTWPSRRGSATRPMKKRPCAIA